MPHNLVLEFKFWGSYGLNKHWVVSKSSKEKFLRGCQQHSSLSLCVWISFNSTLPFQAFLLSTQIASYLPLTEFQLSMVGFYFFVRKEDQVSVWLWSLTESYSYIILERAVVRVTEDIVCFIKHYFKMVAYCVLIQKSHS